MKIIRLIYLLFLFLGLLSCQQNDPLEEVLSTDVPALKKVLEQANKFEIQILYTQIDRDADGKADFTDYSYRLDSSIYFYPASTVKMPVAFLAIERLRKLQKQDVLIDYNTPFRTDSVRLLQTSVQADSTSESALPSIGHSVGKVFLVSNNAAFNRLFEFLGSDYINSAIKEKEFGPARINHRLSIFGIDNKFTNPITFYQGDSVLFYQPEIRARNHYPLSGVNKLSKGKGFIKSGTLVEQAMDFSEKNYLPLKTMHNALKAVIFPDDVNNKHRFDLIPEDYSFLYKCMAQLPGESQYPAYDTSEYYDSYVKFFLFGDSKAPIPDHIRIFNKVGLAYGYLTDCAYIVDFKNKVEFLLSATLHVNENQIYNDGKYEYDEIGFPFLSALGKAVYEYELKRKKEYLPDLNRFESLFEEGKTK